MAIYALSPMEITQLMHDASVADVEGRNFRISVDSSGVKWKVGEGMWTPSHGVLDGPTVTVHCGGCDKALTIEHRDFHDRYVTLVPCSCGEGADLAHARKHVDCPVCS
jgi:hypothetical protein